MLHLPRRPISALLRANLITAGSNTLPLRCSAAVAPLYRGPFPYLPIRPTTGLLKSSRFHSPRPLMLSTSANCRPEVVEKTEGFALLKSKLEKEGIDTLNLKPGKEHRLLCPKCGGGSSKERSCSLFVRGDGQFAKWHCFRTKCGRSGLLKAFGECKSSHGATKIPKSESPRAITEEELQLQPLSMELLHYFSARGISPETLRRNDVRQRLLYNQVFIAFIYRRNGSPVSCKYRGINKKFLQERGTERIFYGLDDIKHAGDIIIVEGEIDKLSMDEAGYSNCVSVPYGARSKVSKEVPNEQELGHKVSIFMELQTVFG